MKQKPETMQPHASKETNAVGDVTSLEPWTLWGFESDELQREKELTSILDSKLFDFFPPCVSCYCFSPDNKMQIQDPLKVCGLSLRTPV